MDQYSKRYTLLQISPLTSRPTVQSVVHNHRLLESSALMTTFKTSSKMFAILHHTRSLAHCTGGLDMQLTQSPKSNSMSFLKSAYKCCSPSLTLGRATCPGGYIIDHCMVIFIQHLSDGHGTIAMRTFHSKCLEELHRWYQQCLYRCTRCTNPYRHKAALCILERTFNLNIHSSGLAALLCRLSGHLQGACCLVDHHFKEPTVLCWCSGGSWLWRAEAQAKAMTDAENIPICSCPMGP